MLEVAQAQEQVLTSAVPRPPRRIPVHESLGLRLAEAIASDIDSPPYDKSIVDGFALVAASAASQNELTVLEEVVAGNVPKRNVTPGTATRIMTGAPIPAGADAVVMVEQTEVTPAGVRILKAPLAGQNILRQGASMRCGDPVLPKGQRLRPGDIGAACEAGRAEVLVIPRPTVAILSTGNELVPVSETPGPGKIRNSNGPMLAAMATREGAAVTNLGVARDDADELRTMIARGLECDLLVLSGGVSAGVLDLVPGVLRDLGVMQVFHKVNVKPGKPVWFGMAPAAEPPRQDPAQFRFVFGLPGNPVSSFVCFELFVGPMIRRLLGERDALKSPVPARLAMAHQHRGDRPTFHPARLTEREDGLWVEPLKWEGSADLRVLTQANALACFPGGDRSHAEGDPIDAYALD